MPISEAASASGERSRGMNGAEFSKLVEVDRSNLAAYEAGAQHINAGLLLRIANVLDVHQTTSFRDTQSVTTD